MKQWIAIWHTQKEWEGYENGASKKILGHFKLKSWTFLESIIFGGHGEREWPLI